MALNRYSGRTQRWNPVADLLELADLYGGRMLDVPDFFQNGGAWHPAVDMLEDNDTVFVKMDLPGLSKDDINISFDGHILSITGVRKEEEMKEGASYRSRERFTGEFHRYIHIPAEISSDKLAATFKDGVLEVSLPKSEKNKLRKIAIQSGEATK
ncbi:MAG: Hsp20/alpha crystallin family protein [Candidatus Abyssobacteria bacterium SURF_5]|uniref:Hsp20/alpha crystallin family protein n=1 Tax=Abyssobacteria bacterium (strain SURF_5) TaxID=2093360 RepID=A0A3A4P8G9_ABYX5|nr:MAG: Hsp20/alpha crystallin family protein [Candidatus Abyssubacteria bacterium SURF_5]